MLSRINNQFIWLRHYTDRFLTYMYLCLKMYTRRIIKLIVWHTFCLSWKNTIITVNLNLHLGSILRPILWSQIVWTIWTKKNKDGEVEITDFPNVQIARCRVHLTVESNTVMDIFHMFIIFKLITYLLK